ncbi:MAG TPA: hypothetical protein VFQ61_01580 [Polyangiaceae bacterium]|nr:hypothetical protein [Polyangiaceae bacterium]
MEPVVLFEEESLILWYHPDENIVHHQLRKFPDSGTFREMLTRGAECLEQYKSKKWLSDDTGNVVVRDSDIEWGNSVWVPRVLRAGFKFWAIVMPVSAVGQLSMQRIAAAHRKLGVNAQTFSDLSSAFSWLKAM